jgi:hypothetical protein
MPPTALKPYWVDEQLNLHEAYFYGESEPDSRPIALKVQGRALTLIAPVYIPKFEIREARVSGEYLFILGEQLEDEEEDDDVDEEGYGIILVAKRCPDRDSTFWTLIAHTLYPETLAYMNSLPPSRIQPPPAGGTDGSDPTRL